MLAKSEDYRDRDLIRQLRCEVEEKKRRCRELLSEAANLRKDRDMIKLDKGDLQIKHYLYAGTVQLNSLTDI